MMIRKSLVLITAVGGRVEGTVLYQRRIYRIKPQASGFNKVVEVDRGSFPEGDDWVIVDEIVAYG